MAMPSSPDLMQDLLGAEPMRQRRAMAKAITLLESTRADHREQGMAQAAKRAAKAEHHALAAPFRDAHAQHHQVVGAGRNGDEQRGGEKAEELFGGQHGRMIGQRGHAPRVLRF